MFNKKKTNEKRKHSGKNLSQYGLFDIPTNLSFEGNEDHDDDNNNDSDLEAELLALSGSDGAKPKRPPKRQPVPQAHLDAMISESLRDIPSDEDLSEDDNDPDLLSELDELSDVKHVEEEPMPPPTSTSTDSISKLLTERLKMYETAESNAKAAGENSRARRFGRGTKTLKDLIKQANAGKPINDEDIPPEVSVNIKKPEPISSNIENDDNNTNPALSPVRQAPAPPPPIPSRPEQSKPQVEEPILTEEKRQLLNILNTRKNEYKSAAVLAKKSGDTSTALNYVKIVKQFDAVIKAVENGQEFDLSSMPGPPEPLGSKTEENEVQNQSDTPVENEETEPEVSLITANSVAEALQQRLDVYKKQEETAKEQGNTSKARRMGRIVKQYEQAVKLNNAGKPIPVDDLPTPPGYAPIPVPGAAISKPEPEIPKPSPEKPKQIKESTPPPANVSEDRPSPPSKSSVSRISGNHVPTTRAEKQVEFLLARQKEFKMAALNAKKKGEIEQAKEYLRTAKGFDPLLEASYAGLPVDVTSLPVPPSARSQLENEYELVLAEECTEEDTDLDVISRLETQLNKQLRMCLLTRDHNKAIGDVAGMNRFEQLALSVTRDLDVVRLAKRTPGAQIPKFHYERKDFSVVKTLTDLSDNDLELVIIRGINYNCSSPKDVDTFVKFEFPYPQEEPFKDRTSTIRDTNNPEYNATFNIPIQRTARTCLRVFKRHSVKFEIYSKGGFLRSDTLLGTVSAKLQPLETQCEIHDSFDLMDGRKKTGGKLEIKLRIRNPLVNKQVEQISEKWLILDH